MMNVSCLFEILLGEISINVDTFSFYHWCIDPCENICAPSHRRYSINFRAINSIKISKRMDKKMKEKHFVQCASVTLVITFRTGHTLKSLFNYVGMFKSEIDINENPEPTTKYHFYLPKLLVSDYYCCPRCHASQIISIKHEKWFCIDRRIEKATTRWKEISFALISSIWNIQMSLSSFEMRALDLTQMDNRNVPIE